MKNIKGLLDMETYDDILEEHFAILDARIEAFESGNVETVTWDDAMERFSLKKND